MLKKKLLASMFVLLVPCSAFASLKSTASEESAIKVIKSAYRFDSVKAQLNDWKRLDAKNVDLDASIKLLESSTGTILSALGSLRDESKVGKIQQLAAVTIDGVALELLRLEKEVKASELPFSSEDRAALRSIFDLQKEISGKSLALPVEAPSENQAIDSLIAETKSISTRLLSLLAKSSGETSEAKAALDGIGKSLSEAKTYFDAMNNGEDTLQNKTFGCLSLGEVSNEMTSLTFGAPIDLRQNPDWLKEIQSLSDALDLAFEAYTCP